MVYKQIKIDITQKQVAQALAGKPIRFTKAQLGKGHPISLHPANRSIVEKAVLAGRGCCLTISPGEIHATNEDMGGNGIFGDIWKGLKSAYKWTKKNVIDTPIYQATVKPLVRKAVDFGATALSGLAPEAAPFINMAKEELGKKTGAFGVRNKANRVARLKAAGLYLS